MVWIDKSNPRNRSRSRKPTSSPDRPTQYTTDLTTIHLSHLHQLQSRFSSYCSYFAANKLSKCQISLNEFPLALPANKPKQSSRKSMSLPVPIPLDLSFYPGSS